MSALANGTLLDGRYELLGQLDRGGMATVYRARDRRLDRLVAVKILDDARRDEAGIAFREDRLTARLAHPHIVAVFDGGTTPEGQPFLVMELIEGQAVSQLAPLPVGRALRIAEDVASAVAYTHECGIVHCDIKPQNILLDGHGQAKLADFGVADADQSASGRLVYGSAPYLAPERLHGAPVSPAVDIYAIGATLYFLLSGEPPHNGLTAEEVIARVRSGPPRRLGEFVPGVPWEAEAIVRRAMAPAPADRYPTAEALCEDLAAIRRASGQTTQALRIVPDLSALAAAPHAADEAATIGLPQAVTNALPLPPSAMPTTVLPPGPPPFVYPEPSASERLGAAIARLAPIGAASEAMARRVAQGAANRTAAAIARGRRLSRKLPPVSAHWLVPALATLLILAILVAGVRTLGGVRTDTANASATAEVPALVGLGLGEVLAQLQARGLALGRVDTAPLPGQPANVVVYQQPPAGTSVEAGTAIDIVIRAAP
jgi:eukaryotic-like serine/threonine-protein kinase